MYNICVKKAIGDILSVHKCTLLFVLLLLIKGRSELGPGLMLSICVVGQCFTCGERVAGATEACQAMGNLYHTRCFVCCSCGKCLTKGTMCLSCTHCKLYTVRSLSVAITLSVANTV